MKKYKHISAAQRDRIGILLAAGKSIVEVARRVKRHPSTIRRERRRSRPFFLAYSPLRASRDAGKKRKRSRKNKKLDTVRLWGEWGQTPR